MKARITKQHTIDSDLYIEIKKDQVIRCYEKNTPWIGWFWCEGIGTDGLSSENNVSENIEVIQKAGWIPKSYVKEKNLKQNEYICLKNYNSKEISPEEGEIVEIMTIESGWAFIQAPLSEFGWIPLENLREEKNQ